MHKKNFRISYSLMLFININIFMHIVNINIFMHIVNINIFMHIVIFQKYFLRFLNFKILQYA